MLDFFVLYCILCLFFLSFEYFLLISGLLIIIAYLLLGLGLLPVNYYDLESLEVANLSNKRTLRLPCYPSRSRLKIHAGALVPLPVVLMALMIKAATSLY